MRNTFYFPEKLRHSRNWNPIEKCGGDKTMQKYLNNSVTSVMVWSNVLQVYEQAFSGILVSEQRIWRGYEAFRVESLEKLFEIRNESGGKTTEIAECESMVFDHYREKTVKESVGNAAKGKRRLESGVENCNKINKRLQDPNTKPTHMETNKNGRVLKGASNRYNRKEEDDDDDDDEDMSMASNCDDGMESSGESTNDDAGVCLSELEIMQMGRRPKVVPKRKKFNERVETKKKNPIANPQAKMKKSKFEFAAEPMDVSDEEDDEKVMQQEYRKCRANPRNLSKKQLAIITAELKKKKKGFSAKIEKKPKKAKAKATPRKKALKKKKGRNESEHDNSAENANCEKSGNVTEQKSSKQAMQNENNSGDSANNNYNTDTAEKKGNSVGDTRNLNNEKAVAEEKKAAAAANKAPGHSDLNAKASKDNEKTEASKDTKAKEKVEDLSKKVDQKEAEDMDEGVDMPESNPQVTRSQKPRHPSIKMMRLSAGKPPKKISPFIKFYMSVYRELCDTLSVRAIAKEAAKRWKGMSAAEKNKFYSKKIG